MKKLLIATLPVIIFFGCAAPNHPPREDLFLRAVKNDGRSYEIWERDDGTRYLKNPESGQIVEIYNGFGR